MIIRKVIKEYIVIDLTHIEQYMKQGYQPYGSPFIFGQTMAEVGKNEDGSPVFGQQPVIGVAMVKYEYKIGW